MHLSKAHAVLWIALAAVSCRTTQVGNAPAAPAAQPPPIVQPGAPGQPSRVISAEAAADVSKVDYIDADIKFMQGMIGHHAQAIEMVALIPTHSSRREMVLLGQRIDISQTDEIKMMQDWLRARGQQVPGVNAMHAHGATLMPGMLTEEEMARLARANGDEFDRRFLEGMIKHHEGALTMVKELFATAGAGQEVSIFSFANDVDIDQRMEIQRMGALLDVIAKEMK
jgi:uncharacterized protein (DUF305 family)